MQLPEELDEILVPIFEALPPEQALGELVVRKGPDEALVRMVEHVTSAPMLRRSPRLLSGIWLYIDDLERSHVISQGMTDATGAFWHGIMHRREGDFGNSHYWFKRVGHHPVTLLIPDYDGHAFIDDVHRLHMENPADLVQRQRLEWQTLFEWCSSHSA
ncbi:MAG: hypothetical protein AMXMBFR84_31090 [Candidatus Hydrogenedentota bacterium]